jgi:inward rectifier potassium channel
MAEKPQSIRLRSQANRFLKIEAIGQKWAPHEDIYHYILTIGWWQFFLFVALAFLGANAVFALGYLVQPGSVSNTRPGSFEDTFFFSVQTMATIGYGNMAPATRFAHVLVTLEAMLGILGVALVTGITFAKFARPTARVLFAEKIVIAKRDGVPHVMFRMANWRHNQVVEAQLRAIVLVLEKTREGETLRVPLELPLVRDRTTFFGLTWMAMHRVDESSLFYGKDAVEKLRAKEAEIFLSLTGYDDTIAQTIHARHRYKLEDIVPNARFADVLTTLPDGTRRIDYRHFHDTIAMPVEP